MIRRGICLIQAYFPGEKGSYILEEKQAKRFTISILVLIFSYSFVNNTPSLFMNSIISDYSLKGIADGSMASMASLGGLCVLVAMPFLQGRVKKWTMLLISGVLQTVIMLCFGFLSQYWLVLAAYILLGAGMGLVDSYGNSSIIDINKGKSSKSLGMLHGVYGVGAFISPFILQALLSYMKWTGVYYVMAGFVALTVVFFIFETKREGGTESVSNIDEPRLKLKEIGGYLKNRYNLLLIGGGVMFSASQTCVAVWIVHYMTVQFGRADLGATALSIMWLFSTISRFFAPRLKIRPLTQFIIGVGMIGIPAVIGILIGTPLALIIAFGVIGLFSGQCMPAIINIVTRDYPGRTSLPTSVMLFMMYIARIIMPLLMGLISAALTISTSMFLPLLTSFIGVLSALMALKIKSKDEIGNEKSVTA